MATLTELNDLMGGVTNSDLLKAKITGALLVAAQTVVANASATPAQKEWARECLASPTRFRDQAFNAVLAANSTATVAAITGANDAAVQAAVNAALPVLTG